jgi:hypothetical protein
MGHAIPTHDALEETRFLAEATREDSLKPFWMPFGFEDHFLYIPRQDILAHVPMRLYVRAVGPPLLTLGQTRSFDDPRAMSDLIRALALFSRRPPERAEVVCLPAAARAQQGGNRG